MNAGYLLPSQFAVVDAQALSETISVLAAKLHHEDMQFFFYSANYETQDAM